MKKNNRILLFFVILCLSLFLEKISPANAAFQDEGVAFYANPSSTGYAIEGVAFYAFDSQVLQPIGTLPVYRYYNSTSGDHFYTTDNSLLYDGYDTEGIAFFAYANKESSPTGTLPVFRFYNQASGDHFYTSSIEEKNTLINNPQWNYQYERIEFYTYDAQTEHPTGTLPIYRFYNSRTGDHLYSASETEKNFMSQAPVFRFYNPRSGDHFFTISENEKSIVANTTKSGYFFEGIAFYSYSNPINETHPIYRFYNSKNGFHFFTALEDEKNSLVNNPQWGYIYENIAFYNNTQQTDGTIPVYRLYDSTAENHFYTASEGERNRLLIPTLGPEISVGLWNYSKTDIMNSPFKITANKTYNIKDVNGNIMAQVGGSSTTSVSYNDNKNQLTVTVGSLSNTLAGTSVTFDAADGDNTSLVFDTNRPSSSYDHYRGKIKVQYYRGADIVGGNTGSTVTQIWIDNILPLEHYVWGMGETTGTGPLEHTKVMTTIFRTYGFWYIKYANKYAAYGFKIRSDSGSQIYKGYDWETQYPNIQKAAQQTRAQIASYGNDVALTPYSSWSDGRTRSWQEVWGGTDYPWCQSVSDPYGKNSSQTTQQLQDAGNHMVGLIANGSLNMANQGWSFDRILKYYYSGIGLPTNY